MSLSCTIFDIKDSIWKFFPPLYPSWGGFPWNLGSQTRPMPYQTIKKWRYVHSVRQCRHWTCNRRSCKTMSHCAWHDQSRTDQWSCWPVIVWMIVVGHLFSRLTDTLSIVYANSVMFACCKLYVCQALPFYHLPAARQWKLTAVLTLFFSHVTT